MLLLGAGMADVDSVQFCWLNRWGCMTTAPAMVTPTSVKVIVPASLRVDVYSVTVCAQGNCSDAAVVNEPDVWWLQTESLLPSGLGVNATTTTVYLGDAFNIVGKGLQFNISQPLCVSQIVDMGSEARQVVLQAVGNPSDLTPLAAQASCYHVRVPIPSNVSAGTYTVLLNSGVFAGNGVPIGTVTIMSPPAAPSGTCAASSVSQLLACLSSASPVTVSLAAGTYAMPPGARIVLPNNSALIGAGSMTTVLTWTGNMTLPALLTGAGSWRAQGLTLNAQAPVQYGVMMDDTCVGCSVDDVHVHIDATMWPASPIRNALAVESSSFWRVSNSVFYHHGNCSSSWPSNCCYYMMRSFNGMLSNNTFDCGCQGYSTDASQQLMVVGNAMASTGADSDGNGYSTFNRPLINEFIYVADNVYVGNPAATKRWESMTYDGPGSLFVGPITAYFVNASGPFVTLGNGVPPSLSQFFPGMLFALMAGTGVGQVRRAVSMSGSVVQLDSPYDVPPAADTIASLLGYRGHMVFERNSWINGTTVQLFGTGIDVVFSGNSFVSMTAGLLGWGRMYQGGWQPDYFVDFIANTFNCTGQLSSFSSTEPNPVPPFNFTGPFNLAHTHRNNVLVGGTNERIAGATFDSIVERNTFLPGVCNGKPAAAGSLTVDPASAGTWVRQ